METRSVSPVFVGRAGELDTLNDALARAGAAEPQALLLGGEAGVGKTRLVEEFAAAARRQGAVVALGGCVEIGADGLPFAPFSTALRALRRELPREVADAAAGQEEELARLLPELGESVPATGSGRHDEESMARLFELTARLLERVAARHTVVLVLEDLHWADASTRHLIAYLVRTLRTGRLVVLATYRSDDIHRRHPLRPLLAELDRLRTVRRIELGRFTRDEVGRQIAGILAHEPDPLQVDEIFERSDGNAFFVEELAVAAHEGCCTGLTDSLRDLLRALDAGFPPGTQRYGWPLLLSAAEAEADARDLPAARDGRAEVLERLAETAKSLTTGAPVWLAHERWVRAELHRAEGRDTPETWSEAVTAFERLERPYDLARVRHRLAGALLESGGEDERARATELLRLSRTVADHLGARPLADAVALLAQRARLTLGRAAGPAPAPADPAEALGLTSRERDVLRLVSDGRTNRQIAEELFISPKTASVHVSNILAKLGVSGRGEAAAVAHRLVLFPAAPSTPSPAR